MKIKYTSNKSSRWSCETERVIYYDGKPMIYIGLPSRSQLTPADTDDLAEFIVFLLNEECATPERGPVKIIAGLKSLTAE